MHFRPGTIAALGFTLLLAFAVHLAAAAAERAGLAQCPAHADACHPAEENSPDSPPAPLSDAPLGLSGAHCLHSAPLTLPTSERPLIFSAWFIQTLEELPLSWPDAPVAEIDHPPQLA